MKSVTGYTKKTVVAFVLLPWFVAGQPAYAEKPEEMNLRQHINNRINNKISDARLRGMLAGDKARAGVVESGDSNCVLQIGNYSPGSNSNQQDTIILGDVINLCKK